MWVRARAAGVLGALLILWQAIGWCRPQLTFFVGSPLGVIKALLDPGILRSLPLDVLSTTAEALSGFFAGLVVGTTLGLLLWLSSTGMRIARPYLIFAGAAPLFTLGPIIVFWCGTGFLSKFVLVFIGTCGLAISQAFEGARHCDELVLRAGRAFGGTRWMQLRYVVAPASVIWVLAGTRSGIGMAMLASVVGEFISSQRGVGHLVIVAEGLYNTNLMIGGALLIGAIALMLNLLVSPLERWACSNNLAGVSSSGVPA
jgi:NitT/TauT family transport system permease protein